MVHDVPEGKYEKKDGTLISISDYDPVELGPYPKCHPHFNEFEDGPGSGVWMKISNRSAAPYPIGHPENPDWKKMADERVKKDTAENRFKWKGLQPNFHLLLLASLSVYIGSLNAVWSFTTSISENDGKEGGKSSAQVLQSEDAYWFPVVGSCALLGLYWTLKYLGTDWVKTAITCWVIFLCTCGLGKNLEFIVAMVKQKTLTTICKIPYVDEELTLMSIIGMLIGGVMSFCYLNWKHFLINNVFGVSFCLLGIRMIALPKFKVGFIMLVGLFFYDIFWVFGSKSVFGANVMVSVATGIEAPIKLMFPREFGGCGMLRNSMLGLGDIVVPGLFICLLAKWDAHRMSEKKCESFVYLNSVMVAYILSLVTTVGIMLFFNHAQPALLYIVPYILIAAFVVAIWRGELKELFAFEIADDAEEEKTNVKEPTETKSEEKKSQ